MKLTCPVCASESVTFIPRQKAEWQDSLSCQNCGHVGLIGANAASPPPQSAVPTLEQQSQKTIVLMGQAMGWGCFSLICFGVVIFLILIAAVIFIIIS
jgi:hypothetical protein